VFILRTIRAPKRKLRAGWFPYLSGALCHDDRGLYPVEYRWFKRGAVWPDTYRWRILFVSGGYILGDIISEVYGFKASRRVIYATFLIAVFVSLTYWIIIALPPAEFYDGQE